MQTYIVTAEMVDSTTGKRFYPGQEFTPADEVQLRRLIAAECLDVPDPLIGSSDLPLDGERDDLGVLALNKANKAQLLVIAAYERADVPESDGATPNMLIAAIKDARRPGYDRDKLGALPLHDRSVDELRIIASYERADVADDASQADLITAIEAKRGTASVAA